MSSAADVQSSLAAYASENDAVHLQRFFKTDVGQYGEGDIFIGVRLPNLRLVCKKHQDLSHSEIWILLESPIHEHRMAGAIILTMQYKVADASGHQAVYELYLKALQAGFINNWDIVDASCEHIVGAQSTEEAFALRRQLARSQSIWCRRVAIVSTFESIKHGDAAPTLEIAEIVLHDSEDLIQKATGWMLREVGKRIDEAILFGFLDAHAAHMPRTTLRYAVERLHVEKRRQYLTAKVNHHA